MPSHYLYVCGNGHEEMRYRNSTRCRKCGLPILRKCAPLPDTELATLRAENDALGRQFAAVSAALLKAEKDVEALRARLVVTPDKAEAAAMALCERAFGNDAQRHWDDPGERAGCVDDAHAALLAAGMEEKA